jgi:hypothetical protein
MRKLNWIVFAQAPMEHEKTSVPRGRSTVENCKKMIMSLMEGILFNDFT